MYITYEEYKDFGGTLSKPAFDSVNYEATVKVDYYTNKRLTNDSEFTDNVKRCIFKLIGLMDTFNSYQKIVTDTDNPVITSQSNDGVSTTFGGYLGATSPQDLANIQKQLDKDIKDVIRTYLYKEVNQNGENLLYRGIS